MAYLSRQRLAGIARVLASKHSRFMGRVGATAMGKKHGAKQQKRLAKQKAKRQATRTVLARSSSKDPTIRLSGTEKWAIVEALVSSELWNEGIGYLVLAR